MKSIWAYIVGAGIISSIIAFIGGKSKGKKEERLETAAETLKSGLEDKKAADKLDSLHAYDAYKQLRHNARD